MAKSPEKPEDKPTPAKPAAAGPQPTPGQQQQPGQQPQQGQQQQQPQIQVDESRAVTAYANFCRVTGTPEELIIDFALNPQPMGVPTKPINVDQRIVLSFYTAKRLMAALQLSLQRHEATFGVLETDIQKRVRPSAQAQPRPQS